MWRGEDKAATFVELTVEKADATGRLRGILDAVRSNRVADDFSARWSYAREDFERKLYRKRNKITVKFVELPETIPVQGPDTKVQNRVVFADFMALLNERERHQIVILLSRGHTNLTDIAAQLGYANHSPISKRSPRFASWPSHSSTSISAGNTAPAENAIRAGGGPVRLLAANA